MNAIELNLKVKKAIGSAPIQDLTFGYAQKQGNRVIETLLGCTPKGDPERFQSYSPIDHVKSYSRGIK